MPKAILAPWAVTTKFYPLRHCLGDLVPFLKRGDSLSIKNRCLCGTGQNYFLGNRSTQPSGLHLQGPHPDFSSRSSHRLTPSDRTFFLTLNSLSTFTWPTCITQAFIYLYTVLHRAWLVHICMHFSSDSAVSSMITENSLCSHNTSHNVNTQQVLNKCFLHLIARGASLHLTLREGSPNLHQKVGKSLSLLPEREWHEISKKKNQRINNLGHVRLFPWSHQLF